jgi:hypothetical protein
MAEKPVLFAGDPHGNFSPILRACAALAPGTLIIVGDLGLSAPLPQIFTAVIEAGWQIRWIMGNHDTETEEAYDFLLAHDGNLGLRVSTIGRWRIAGLPGVFRPRVWGPEDGPPSYSSRTAFQAALRPGEPWRGGLPLAHRDTIFPEDFTELGTQPHDILVSHEAPSSHIHGHKIIDDLAAKCGARLIVHGHHHRSYEATLSNGIRVKGLGLAEPWLLDLF